MIVTNFKKLTEIEKTRFPENAVKHGHAFMKVHEKMTSTVPAVGRSDKDTGTDAGDPKSAGGLAESTIVKNDPETPLFYRSD